MVFLILANWLVNNSAFSPMHDQLVERCTCIAEVMGSNHDRVRKVNFQTSLRSCVNFVHNREDKNSEWQ